MNDLAPSGNVSSRSRADDMQRDAAPALRELFNEFLGRTNAGYLAPTENAFAIFVRAGGYANAVDVSLSAFDEFLARSISPRNPRPKKVKVRNGKTKTSTQ